MSAYHQMGHDSENLLSVDELSLYKGAILSPVNYGENKIASQIEWAQGRNGFETIFDPQLYVPNSERGCLREWSYFPVDVDTADMGSDTWWEALLNEIVAICTSLRPTAVSSPAVLPKVFSDDYYSQLISVGNHLCTLLAHSGMTPI